MGEEYCSILQVDQNERKLPNLFSRLLLTIEPLLTSLLHFKHPHIIQLTSALSSIYVGLFYLGVFKSYNPIKMILGLRYIFHPRRTPTSAQPYRQLYRALGAFSLTMGTYSLLRQIKDWYTKQSRENLMAVEIEQKLTPSETCSLCLGRRIDSTRLPCGHLFCWYCICAWLEHRGQCPLCRQDCKHADLLFIPNL